MDTMDSRNFETILMKIEAVLNGFSGSKKSVIDGSKKSVIDDTSLHKLFSLFEAIFESKIKTIQVDGKSMLLNNDSYLKFLRTPLSYSDVVVSACAIKSIGLTASDKSGFNLLKSEGVIPSIFFEIKSSPKWKEPIIRDAFFVSLSYILAHDDALQVCLHLDLYKLAYDHVNDQSIFVSKSASKFLISLAKFKESQESCEYKYDICRHISKYCNGSMPCHVLKLLLETLADICKDNYTLSSFCSDELHVKEILYGLISNSDQNVIIETGIDFLLILFHLNLVELEQLTCILKSMIDKRNLFGVLLLSSCLIISFDGTDDVKELLEYFYIPCKCATDFDILRNSSFKKSSLTKIILTFLNRFQIIISKSPKTDITIGLDKVLDLCCLTNGFDLQENETNHFIKGNMRLLKAGLEGVKSSLESDFMTSPYAMEILQKVWLVIKITLKQNNSDSQILSKSYYIAFKVLKLFMMQQKVELVNEMQGLLLNSLKRGLIDTEWEVRDTCFETISHICDTYYGCELFSSSFVKSGLPRFILDGTKDSQSYVRAAAIKCVGKILHFNYDSFVDACNSNDSSPGEFVSNLIKIVNGDDEAFPRRAALEILTSFYNIPCGLNLSTVYSCLVNAIHDLDWEVKRKVIFFWDNVLLRLFSNRGFDMILLCQSDISEVDTSKRMKFDMPDKDIVKNIFDEFCGLGGHQVFVFGINDCDPSVKLCTLELIVKLKTVLSSCGFSKSGNSEFDKFLDMIYDQKLDDDISLQQKLNGDFTDDPNVLLDDILMVAKEDSDNLLDCY